MIFRTYVPYQELVYLHTEIIEKTQEYEEVITLEIELSYYLLMMLLMLKNNVISPSAKI